jgi:FtsH-binding integral membrane protein
MAKSLSQPQVRSSRGKRYSLRTLFFVSIAIAVPFLLVANVRHSIRPEQSVASPLYLMLGIAGMVLAAAIGSALGSRTSMLVAACLAAFCWIGAVVLCGLFSQELSGALPVHVMGATITVAILAYVAWSAKKSGEIEPEDTLLRLLRVKRDVRESQQAKERKPTSPD